MSPSGKICSSLGPTEVAIQPGLLHYYVQLLSSNSLYCWIILSHLLVSLLVIRWSSDLGIYKNFTLGCCRKYEAKEKLRLLQNKAVIHLLSNTDWTKKRIWKQRWSNNTLLVLVLMPGTSLQSLDKYDLPSGIPCLLLLGTKLQSACCRLWLC